VRIFEFFLEYPEKIL